MKRFGIITLMSAVVLLAGCATNRDTGALVGGVTGGILGSTIGGGTGRVVATGVGAAVGAAVGSAVGDDMDRNRSQPRAHAPVESRTVVVHEPSRVVIIAEQCYQYPDYTAERAACERGARQRYAEDLRRRENEAYKVGRGL